MSHDLKSPLVTIKGFLGLVRKAVTTGRHKNLEGDLNRIADAADQMGRLLEDLLELSRIGRVVHPSESVALGELAQAALQLVAGPLTERGIDVEVGDGLPVVVGDRLRLLEVFQNLIENAVKFMGNQPAPRIEVGMRQSGDEPVFFVKDNGVGIDPRYHDRVFDLFDRLETSQEGTGIGLALCKRIIEFHGGRLWVESEGQDRAARSASLLPGAKNPGRLTSRRLPARLMQGMEDPLAVLHGIRIRF